MFTKWKYASKCLLGHTDVFPICIKFFFLNRQWLPDHKGLAGGIIVAGFGGGALIFGLVQTAFINPHDLSPEVNTGTEGLVMWLTQCGRKKLCSDHDRTKHTLYVALTCEQWCVFSGSFGEKISRDIESVQYVDFTNIHCTPGFFNIRWSRIYVCYVLTRFENPWHWNIV